MFYARSKDDEQLYGNLKKTLSANCKDPYKTRTMHQGNDSWSLKIAPCGAIADSLFNGKATFAHRLFGVHDFFIRNGFIRNLVLDTLCIFVCHLSEFRKALFPLLI